jgi:aryl-alcohol dehydrogenase
MSLNATAAVLRQAEQPFTLEAIELDELRPDEVLVRNEASGICHTDVLATGRVPLPAVFGHEAAGVVEKVGSAVTRIRPGDRVLISYPWCGACPHCDRGEPYLCSRHMELVFGGTRLDGSHTLMLQGQPISGAFFQQSSFATHSIALDRAVVAVHSDLPSRYLAATPCGVQTGAGAILYSLRVSAAESLVVFGVGAVGLSAIIAGHLVGATPLIAVDRIPERLALARELGATHTVNATGGELIAQIREVARNGVDVSLETSGNEHALEAAIGSLATGGRCGMVIAPHLGQKYPFSPSEIFTRAATLIGIIQGSAVPRVFLNALLELHAKGRFPFERMVRHYDFSDINRAFEDAKAGRTIKPVLEFRQ